MKDFLEEFLAVKLPVALFGFCGGLLALAFRKSIGLKWAFATVFSGLLSAIVFTPMVQHLWNFPPPFENGIAFILGIGGMALVGKIHDWVSSIQLNALIRKHSEKE